MTREDKVSHDRPFGAENVREDAEQINGPRLTNDGGRTWLPLTRESLATAVQPVVGKLLESRRP